MPVPPESVLGYQIEARTPSSCIRDICTHIETGKPAAYLACLNTYSYVTSRKDAEFSASLSAAKWLVPDGAGILLASKLNGGQLGQRLTGDDIFQSLCKAAPENTRVFFLGSSEETLIKIRRRFKADFPELTMAGTLSPPFKPEFSKADNTAMLAAINQAQPDILWVGLTAPKQEKWLHKHISALDIRFAAGIGAVFDFYAGNTPRAPLWMQNSGLEWLYRLAKNPRKLAGRYLTSNPIFLGILARQYLAAKLKRAPR